MIHIGTLIHDFLEQRRTRRVVLARLLNIGIASLLEIEKKQTIQTDRLLDLCRHLNHNFFMDIAMQLPATYTTNKDIFAEKNQEIDRLKKEIEQLQIEKDLLLQLKSLK